MRVVVDASVAVKWILPDPAVELDADQAVSMLSHIKEGALTPLQPPHWLAEVAAVITRLHPEVAPRAIELLHAMELPIAGELEIYLRASRIAEQLRRHVFDTLFHALALERDATLITADDAYFKQARRLGRIVRLWELPTLLADPGRADRQE